MANLVKMNHHIGHILISRIGTSRDDNKDHYGYPSGLILITIPMNIL